MLLLLDIGNTHTHFAFSDGGRLSREGAIPTRLWQTDEALARLLHRRPAVTAAALCSVVPAATRLARRSLLARLGLRAFELTHRTVSGVGIDYPRPDSIGPDRLANAIAARHRFGAPVVVVDFGTAVTFDVVNARGDYAGGIIAPGLAAMTSYLHEKTALLPEIKIRETKAVIGKSTEEAMLIGAVHGYRGLVRELIVELRRELNCRQLPVVATGGYAGLIAARLPEIAAVEDGLTLDGLRLAWQARDAKQHSTRPARPGSLRRA